MASRPSSAPGLYQAVPGQQYFDTTLSKLVIYDGQSWRDPVNGTAV
jgi:hypothetical protein